MKNVINGKLLDKAVSLFKKRRYADVVDLLTPHLLSYGDSYLYFKLMTISSLMILDWSGAAAYLKTAVRLERYRDPDLQIVRAVILMKTGETAESYRILFELERNGKWGDLTKELLEASRHTENRQALTEVLETLIKIRLGKIRPDAVSEIPGRREQTFYTSRAMRVHPAAVAVVFGVCAFLSLTGIGIYFGVSARQNREPVRTEGDSIRLTREDQLAVYDIRTRYFLTDKEIERSFSRLRSYYRSGDDNMAQREINRIKESNAAIDVKDKASAFERLLSEKRAEKTKTFFTYDEVSRDPFLYHKTLVVWRGSPANLRVTDSSITFDFLVGYENKKFLEGTVPVYVDYAVKLYEGEAYEIEGEILAVDDNSFRLHAFSVRRIQIN